HPGRPRGPSDRRGRPTGDHERQHPVPGPYPARARRGHVPAGTGDRARRSARRRPRTRRHPVRPQRQDALLVLEDGFALPGRAYAAEGRTVGEIVFATAMTGYQETVTDPSYHRQIVTMTAPHIGNTGANEEDSEAPRGWGAGLVSREAARRASSWRSTREFEDELHDQGVVGICGVDTRALTRHLRDRGV